MTYPKLKVELPRGGGWQTCVLDNGDGTEDVVTYHFGKEVERFRRPAPTESVKLKHTPACEVAWQEFCGGAGEGVFACHCKTLVEGT